MSVSIATTATSWQSTERTTFKVKWFNKRTEHREMTTITIEEDGIWCPKIPVIKFKYLRQIGINKAIKGHHKKQAFTLVVGKINNDKRISVHFKTKNNEQRNKILLNILSKLPSTEANRNNMRMIPLSQCTQRIQNKQIPIPIANRLNARKWRKGRTECSPKGTP